MEFIFIPFMLLFSLIGLLLWIWALVEVLRSKEEDTTKILWILILIFLPLIG